jgi:integrase
MRNAGEASLFPEIKRKEEVRAGEHFGRWFNDVYREQQGVKQRWQDFHALRHTVKTRLVAENVNPSIISFITGHADTGRGSAAIYEHPDTIPLAVAQALDKLKYPELDLKRVYWPQK